MNTPELTLEEELELEGWTLVMSIEWQDEQDCVEPENAAWSMTDYENMIGEDMLDD